MAANNYIQIAVDEAQKSDLYAKHGSVMVAHGKIVSRGHNHSRTTITGRLKYSSLPKRLRNNCVCSVHSEMDCLLNSVRRGSWYKQRPLREWKAS